MSINSKRGNGSVDECIEMFALDGTADILDESHFGIINGRITTNVLKSNVLSFRTLFAPPYATSDFWLEGRVFGELVKTANYRWLPHEVRRKGSIRGIEVSSVLTLVDGQRSLILEIELTNTADAVVRVPIQFELRGGADYVTAWEFVRPKADKRCQTTAHEGGSLLLRQNDAAGIAIGANVGQAGEPIVWEPHCAHWRTAVAVPAHGSRTIHLALAIGEPDDALPEVRELMKAPATAVERSQAASAKRLADLLDRLPRFKASDERLERFYYRSALHLLLNQWQVSEFVLNPLYSTGSVNGGCVCSYLWDFSEGWELFPIYDPAALREHIKAFLGINLTKHFAFNPLGGAGWGPWYYINQEKIVFLIYHYVLLTGDTAFLDEHVKGKTVIEWVIHHAMFGDRMEAQANLIDYGSGNHHLELRGEYHYDNYIPDLNLRRIPTYHAAEGLCRLAGHDPQVDFVDRAEKLKQLIHDEMWSDEHRWWFYIDARGDKHLRYTLQLFKLVASNAIDPHEERALVGHLNEAEFLSEFGLHSMAKHDPAYDQIDIDNGGGGACCCFPPQVIERLYKAGYPSQAEDILQRILWWGDRLPYWSDSLVANAMDYRRDTPLQNAIGAVAGAQAILFGMFGIQVDIDGVVTINPAPPTFSPEISIEGVPLRGLSIDVQTFGDGTYEVRDGSQILRYPVGTPTRLETQLAGAGHTNGKGRHNPGGVSAVGGVRA